jgi:hypothetical protein
VLGGEPQPDQAAPVLADEGEPAQIQPVERERADPFDVPRIAVVAPLGRLVRPAEADQVGRDRPQTVSGQDGHDLPVEERPAGLPVQEQDRLAVRRSRLDVGHPHAAHIDVARRVAEVRDAGEPFVGGTQNLHPLMLPRPARGLP